MIDHSRLAAPTTANPVPMNAGPSPGGVVACVERLAANVGAEILRAGGNAADAAVATAFAQGVVDPIYCGIAGGFHGVFHDAARGMTRVVMADSRTTAI